MELIDILLIALFGSGVVILALDADRRAYGRENNRLRKIILEMTISENERANSLRTLTDWESNCG